jgi:hypothetical protein
MRMGMLSASGRKRLICVVAGVATLGAAGAALGAVSSDAAVSQTMTGFVHDDASIGLSFADGSNVGNQALSPPVIPPGTYTIQVTDDTTEHNFHIFGQGVDQLTDIGGTGTQTWTVNLQPGTSYRFQCDAHPDFMWGTFTTSGTNPNPPSTTKPTGSTSVVSSGTTSSGKSPKGGSSTSFSGVLTGLVGASGRLSLSLNGTPVTKLRAGRYRIIVVDKSPSRSFLVRKKGGPAITVSGVSATGTHSATVSLTHGTWSYYTSAGAKSTGSFSVS